MESMSTPTLPLLGRPAPERPSGGPRQAPARGARPWIHALAGLLTLATACGRAPGAPGAPGRYDRVVLITIDTLRADHLRSYGYVRQTSPFLDSLAERGVVFEETVSTMSHTAPSHSSIFTGLLPMQHGVLKNGDVLPETIPTLASEYARAGYATGAFMSNSFLARTCAGFETVDAELRRGDATTDAALDWIDDQGQRPFFLWVHYFDVHEAEIAGWELPPSYHAALDRRTPLERPELYEYLAELHGLEHRRWDGEFPGMRWEARPELRSPFLETRADFVDRIDEYDAQIAFVDDRIEELFEAERASDPDGTALWVVTSDHGEGLGSHGYRGHDGHIYQAQLHVPLILHATDGSLPARRIASQVSSVDVFPTLVGALGPAARQPAAVEGTTLWPALSPEAAPLPDRALYAQKKPMPVLQNSQYTVLGNRRKYILHTAPERVHEFYDLSNDPRELVNRIEDPDAERYRELLEQKLDELQEARAASPNQENDVPPEILAELEALGYVGEEE